MIRKSFMRRKIYRTSCCGQIKAVVQKGAEKFSAKPISQNLTKHLKSVLVKSRTFQHLLVYTGC